MVIVLLFELCAAVQFLAVIICTSSVMAPHHLGVEPDPMTVAKEKSGELTQHGSKEAKPLLNISDVPELSVRTTTVIKAFKLAKIDLVMPELSLRILLSFQRFTFPINIPDIVLLESTKVLPRSSGML